MSEKIMLPVVAGPTASGKTACAVALCRLIGGEVVSADSMQIYRGMRILSAMPDEEEMQGIPHHMLGFADPAVKYSAAHFGEAAKQIISEIHARGHVPVLCGGTGLYIDAVTRPMSFSKESDDALHTRLMQEAELPGGRRKMHDRLKEIDPESAARLHENDVRRVVRAVEIYMLTGITQTEHSRRDAEAKGDYDERLFALEWSREALYARTDRRVDIMVQNGLIEEVRSLMQMAEKYPTAEQAIGYKEIAAALEGRMTMEEAIIEVKKATRNLAKRQMTWLRRDRRTEWIAAEGRDAGSIAAEIAEKISLS